MSSSFINRAKANTSTTGTGTITLGSTVVPFQSWSAAGAVNGLSYSYLIEEGNAWEIGIGVYSSGGGTVTRSLVESSTGSLLSLTGSATISSILAAADINALAIYKLDTLINGANSTSYADPYATMGTRMTANANLQVAGLYIDSRVENGGSYVPVVYEIHPTTGAFVAEIAVGTSRSFTAQVLAQRVWRFVSPVNLVSGTSYAFCLRRTDGTNASNAGLRFFNGGNGFQDALITIVGVYAIANKATPGVGDLPGIFSSTTTVWTMGVLYNILSQ